MKNLKYLLAFVMILCMLPVASFAEVTYPFTESVELSYWTPIANNAISYISTYNENEAIQEINKKTGLNVTFEHPAIGQEKQSVALMIAGGEMPDIVNYSSFDSVYTGGLIAAMDEGVILDLTDLLPVYAPDYWEWVKDDPLFQTSDGRYAAIYTYYTDENTNPPYRRLMTRQEWLEQAQMEPPQTLAELEAYFKWIQENLPGVEPFLLSPVGDGYEAVIWGTFDILDEWFIGLDGKVNWGRAAGDDFKAYLTTMHDWHQKGYIAKDWATASSSEKKAAYVAGTVGVAISSCDDFRQLAIAAGFEAASLPYIKKDENALYHAEILNSNNGGSATVISATCENVEAALAYLNYFYTEEGKMISNFGVEGLSWNYDENGVPKYTEHMLHPENFSAESANYIYRCHNLPKWQYITTMNNAAVVQDPDAVAMRMRWTDDPKVDNALRMPVGVTLTADESLRRSEIMADITTYTAEMTAKFINGQADLADYDEYLKTLDAMGFQEAREITQTAYERYLKNQ